MPDSIALVPEKATRVVGLEGSIDGFPAESYQAGTETGDSPLETGASVTDHAVAKPESVSLTGKVRGIQRSTSAWADLRGLRDDIEPLQIVTPFATFEEMILKSVNANRIGDGLEFSLQFEQILRVGLAGGSVTSPVGSQASGRTSLFKLGRITPRSALDALQSTENIVDGIVNRNLAGFEPLEITKRQRELDALNAGTSNWGSFMSTYRRTVSSVGNPARMIRSPTSISSGFRDGGSQGLVSAMNRNLELPPTISRLTSAIAGTDAPSSRSNSATLMASSGDRGIDMARALESGGARGINTDTGLERARLVIGRRFSD